MSTLDYIYPIIVPSDSDVEDAFSSTNTPDYIPASPDYSPASSGNTSSDPSEDLSMDLLASLAISPFHNDPYMKVMQAYNATSNESPILPPRAPITPPTVLPPSSVERTLVDLPNGNRAIGTKWVYRNKKDERRVVIKNKERLVPKGTHKKKELIMMRWMSRVLFFMVRLKRKSMFVNHQYLKIQTFSPFPPSTPLSALLPPPSSPPPPSNRVYVDDIIFGSTKKKLCTKFEKMMHKKFQMSSMGELIFFLGLQVKQKEDGIFISQDKYLKGQPKLGLWYLKDSPFYLVAYTDSDYAEASLDKNSTTGGCQFLGCRLISWQCKKQTVVANSTIVVEYVAASSCCGQFTSPSDGKIECCYEGICKKRSSMEDANANNQKFNFSKYIFESMMKNLDSAVKFLMYPRFEQVFLNNQLEGMETHNRIYIAPSHTKMVFANMKRQGKDFSGRVTSLFPTMVIQAQEEQGEGSNMPTIT
ncbi:putative ribonuclease H-like domain-containing protein [Tanacetum coccineum]